MLFSKQGIHAVHLYLMFPVIVSMDCDIVLCVSGFYSKPAGSRFLKTCCLLGKLNLLNFLLFIHESLPLSNRPNCANRTIRIDSGPSLLYGFQ